MLFHSCYWTVVHEISKAFSLILWYFWFCWNLVYMCGSGSVHFSFCCSRSTVKVCMIKFGVDLKKSLTLWFTQELKVYLFPFKYFLKPKLKLSGIKFELFETKVITNRYLSLTRLLFMGWDAWPWKDFMLYCRLSSTLVNYVARGDLSIPKSGEKSTFQCCWVFYYSSESCLVKIQLSYCQGIYLLKFIVC